MAPMREIKTNAKLPSSEDLSKQKIDETKLNFHARIE